VSIFLVYFLCIVCGPLAGHRVHHVVVRHRLYRCQVASTGRWRARILVLCTRKAPGVARRDWLSCVGEEEKRTTHLVRRSRSLEPCLVRKGFCILPPSGDGVALYSHLRSYVVSRRSPRCLLRSCLMMRPRSVNTKQAKSWWE
ncbi:unnamed protein product, partial [Hapterophycus canaliculatus]